MCLYQLIYETGESELILAASEFEALSKAFFGADHIVSIVKVS